MDWILLEAVTDAGAELVALELRSGARRVLYRNAHPAPLRPAVHPRGLRIAIDAVSRNALRGEHRARVGVINLENGGIGWLRQSLDPQWRIGGAVFDDTGERMALEGARGGAPMTDIYIHAIDFKGNSARESVLAGAGGRHGLGAQRPVFLPGGNQLVYFLNTRPDGWEVCLLDLEQTGDSAFAMEGRAPSVLSLPLTDGAEAVPAAGLSWSPALAQAFFVAKTRGGARQRVRSVDDGRQVRDLGKDHLRVEELCVSAEGRWAAWSADGQVWLAHLESGAAEPVVRDEPGSSHRGLVFDEERLLFCTSDDERARLFALELDGQRVVELRDLGGDTTVLSLLPMPGDVPRLGELILRLSDATGTEGGPKLVPTPAPEDDDRPTVVERVKRRPEADEAITARNLFEAEPTSENRDTVRERVKPATADIPEVTAEPIAEPPPVPAEKPSRRKTGKTGKTKSGSVSAGDTGRTKSGSVSGGDTGRTKSGSVSGGDTGRTKSGSVSGGRAKTSKAPPAVVAPEATPAPKKGRRGKTGPVPSVPPAEVPEPGLPPISLPTIERGASPTQEPLAPISLPPVAYEAPQPAYVHAARAPEVAPILAPPAAVAAKPAVEADGGAPQMPAPIVATGDPAADFVGWIKRLGQTTDPAAELRRLEPRKDEPLLRDAARMYLRMLVRRAAKQPEAVADLVYALGAVAHLQLREVRDTLRELCVRARERLDRTGELPEVEEHFALAALRYIEGRESAFDLSDVYEEYESMLAQSTSVLESAGEEAAAGVVASFATMYREELAEVVRASGPVAPVKPAPPAPRPSARLDDDEWAQLARAARDKAPGTTPPRTPDEDEWTQVAKVARAKAPPTTPPRPAADDWDPLAGALRGGSAPAAGGRPVDDEWGDLARTRAASGQTPAKLPVQAAAKPAAQAPAAQAPAAQAPQRTPEPQPRVTAPPPTPAAERPAAQAAAPQPGATGPGPGAVVAPPPTPAADAAARPASPFRGGASEEEDDWKQARASAQAQVAAEDDEWSRKAQAARSGPHGLGAASTPTYDTRWDPPRPAESRTPRRSAELPPVPDNDWAPLAATPVPRASVWSESRRTAADRNIASFPEETPLNLAVVSGGTPPTIVITAVLLLTGGLTELLLGLRLGLAWMLIGGVGIGAAPAIMSDRPWGWLCGLAATFFQAVFLLFVASGHPPAWMPVPLLTAGAVGAGLCFVNLLRPSLRKRYDRRAIRF